VLSGWRLLVVIPKFVVAIPFVVLGALAPGLTSEKPLPRRPNLVGMEQVKFDRDVIRIRQGQQIQFVNNSNFLHVLAPGDRARVSDVAGVPSFGPDDLRSMPRGDPFVTGSWDEPGSYDLTCTLHPEMNLKVVVDA
jgi:plastocyanin